MDGLFLSRTEAREQRGRCSLIILGIINILALMDIAVACGIFLFKLHKLNEYFAFEAINHVVVGLVAILLISTECQWGESMKEYYNTNWPMFGEEAGYYTLAAIMLALGCSILGHLNIKAYTETELGTLWYRIVLSAGCVAVIVSVINVGMSWYFGSIRDGIGARAARAPAPPPPPPAEEPKPEEAPPV